MTTLSPPRRHLAALALAALLAWPLASRAQTPAAPEKVQLLFVQNSSGVAIERNTLRLRNVGASTLFFTDRPVRIAGHYHTKGEFLKLWSEGPDSFARNPPNATLSFIEPNRPQLLDVVINIRNPRMQGADLLYDFTVIEGTMPKKAGAAVLFIDILGFWRRNLVRAAIVGNAAYRGAYAGEAAAQQRAAAPAPAAAPAAPAPAYGPPATLPPPGPNAQHTQASATAKLEQLKQLERDGLITSAQYQKAAQQIVNELVQ